MEMKSGVTVSREKKTFKSVALKRDTGLTPRFFKKAGLLLSVAVACFNPSFHATPLSMALVNHQPGSKTAPKLISKIRQTCLTSSFNEIKGRSPERLTEVMTLTGKIFDALNFRSAFKILEIVNLGLRHNSKQTLRLFYKQWRLSHLKKRIGRLLVKATWKSKSFGFAWQPPCQPKFGSLKDLPKSKLATFYRNETLEKPVSI